MKKIMLFIILITIIVVLFPFVILASITPDDIQKEKIFNKVYRMTVPFIENRGQVESKEVGYYAKTFGGTLFVEKDGTLTYNLPFEDKGSVVIKETFTGKKLSIKGLESSPTRINYFKGKDQSKWRTNIPSYESLSLGEIYKGINLTLKAYGKNVEKLFTVLPGEGPDLIQIKLQGAKGLKINESGELEVLTEFGPVKFTKPLAYQEIGGKRVEVNVSYNLLNPQLRTSLSALTSAPVALSYGFKVGGYNKDYPLIIDPLLASTFIGGGNYDAGHSIALDGSGNVYVTGFTTSTDYPTTAGAYDDTHNGAEDVFVSKFDSDLTNLLASTLLGGSTHDKANSMTIDGNGNIYITGNTESTDYPTTFGAYDETHNGVENIDRDVFVSKLDSSLSTLLASTFIGGDCPPGNDSGVSLAVDGSGNVYVAGNTDSNKCSYPDPYPLTPYPTTPGAYKVNPSGHDGFISKLDSNLSTLIASTRVGGTYPSVDVCRSIALDGSGNVYVTGTGRKTFPITPGAYGDEWIPGDGGEVFVSKFDSDLTNLLASTLLGGTSDDHGYSLVLDGSNVYVTGSTISSDYPTTAGAYDEIYEAGDDGEVFVSKFDSSLSTLLVSTYIGGSTNDIVHSMTIDGDGNLYITGETSGSSDYPTTPGAYDESQNGSQEVFVSKLNNDLSSLLTSTFIGGMYSDGGRSIALDGSGNVYVTGFAGSGYPTTAGAYEESCNAGNSDVFVSILDGNLSAGPVGELDSDGDDIPDDEDNCPFIANPEQEDNDLDGDGDVCDNDDDNDGAVDTNDNCQFVANPEQEDNDLDGEGDVCDSDDDDDSILDTSDNCPFIANSEQENNDGDDEGDVCDSDDDDDGVIDTNDNCQFVANEGQSDIDIDGLGDVCDDDPDGDGVIYNDNCPLTPNPLQENNDLDLDGDVCDPDDDNDGVLDVDDNCSLTANPSQFDLDVDNIGDACDIDIDGDGIDNDVDNCPLVANVGQDDTDLDGDGDACDADDDDDGVPDDSDNCPLMVNPVQTDSDNDGQGDVCDGDLDGDGVDNEADNCPTVANVNQNDWDSDGLGDACDDDLDGDGVINDSDECEFTPVDEVVDPSNGCAIEQLVPCEGPRGTTELWKNHGKHVSTLAHTTNSFLQQGLITEEEKDAIMGEGASSDCGVKK